jgi:RNA polymerase sigma-70 factor (ECF subfamily)
MIRDEPRLVLRAQAGDPQAFDQLLRGYERPLFRHLCRMLGGEDEAYDVLQQTFLAIVRSLRNLQQREHFRAWAYGVATRICLKALARRSRGEEPLEDPDQAMADPATLPDLVAEASERRQALLSRVQGLSPRVRSVLLLHFYEELPLKEVAAALEISLGTAKSRLGAGLLKLRSMEECHHVR